MSADRAGLIQSMLVKAQRDELDEIGRRVGTPVVYLKAAWADPVLYGGRGERVGCDIDVLVRAAALDAFAAELEHRGFSPNLTAADSGYFRAHGKELPLRAPPGRLHVDVHRHLSERPFFEFDPAGCLARAIPYDSGDGQILSLCPEDQVLYAASHYATHHLAWDGRHLEDTVRLLAARRVDWPTIERRATQSFLGLVLVFLVEALRARGTAVPTLAVEGSPLRKARRLALERWFDAGGALGRGRRRGGARRERLLFLPLLSDRVTALPRHLMRRASARVRNTRARPHDS